MFGIKSIYLNPKTKKYIKQFVEKINLEQYSQYLDCFICGGNNYKNINETDRYGLSYYTGVCLACGHVQQFNYLNDEAHEIFYSSHYRNIYQTGTPEELFFRQYFKAAKKIEKFVGDINFDFTLEIGSGPGGILKYFEKNKFSKVLGIDLDQRFLDYGIKKGLNLVNTSFENFNTTQKFDLIIICHVLEHVQNPIEILKKVNSLLNEGGLVYIEVPSIESVKNGDYGGDIKNYFHIAHVSHFTEKSIVNLLNNTGYQIVKFNNTIQLLAKKCSKDINEDLWDNNSLNYTENLLRDINNKNVPTIMDNLKLIIIYIFRFLKIKKFLEIIRTKIFKFLYHYG
jgi:2-polyprenyl-3-methyl-5-hydroxy-6-metoxy-1,4-benzoquinol methylase